MSAHQLPSQLRLEHFVLNWLSTPVKHTSWSYRRTAATITLLMVAAVFLFWDVVRVSELSVAALADTHAQVQAD